MDGRSIFAAEHLFVIVQFAGALEQVGEFLAALRGKVELGGNVQLQDFFAAAVAENADQSVVDFDEAALRRRNVNPLLNIVEQFAIAAFGFTAVGDVLEHMHGLQLGTAGGVNAGS